MNRTIKSSTERVYVKVNSDFDNTGHMQPRSITWDDGRTFPIESVRDFRPAEADEKSKCGYCYIVLIRCSLAHTPNKYVFLI